MNALLLSVPSYEDQRAIAEVLGALDDKVAANAGLLQTSEEFVSALYRRACEKASGSEPFLSALDTTFGEPFSGEHFSPPGTGRPLLRIRDIVKGRCDIWTTETRHRETLIQAGEVIAGMDAEFRPQHWLGSASLLNQRVCRTRSPRFGGAFARQMAAPALHRIENEKSGTTVIHLNKADPQSATVVVPTGSTAHDASALADEVISRAVSGAQESTRLAQLRDTLLPALMDGTLRVRDAIKQAEEVL